MPTRIVRATLLIALAVAVTAASVWFAANAQRRAAVRAAHQTRAAAAMLTAMLDADTSLRGFSLTADPAALRAYATGNRHFAAALLTVREQSKGDRAASASVIEQATLARRWHDAAEHQVADVRARGAGHVSVPQALLRKQLMDRFRAANSHLQDLLARRSSREQRRAGLVAVVIIVALSALLALLGFFALVRPARRESARRAEEDAYTRTQAEFTHGLQHTRSEAEARELLRRHVERTIPGSTVVVLEQSDRLERLQAGTEFPLLVGGEAIGSVLLEHDGRLAVEQSRRVADAIGHTAPVLANLRNLAIAETLAATDALTGLPNRRALQDAMRRMLAQADRTGASLSVLAIDLDHFKRINDTHGHEEGDAVLAAVGGVLGSAVRASDFVARYGGEELVVLAPDTDAAGALRLADKLRQAMATIDLPADGGRLTASFGVAAFPEHGADAETLMRAADRALYEAKLRGRDRVELAPAGQGLVEPVSS